MKEDTLLRAAIWYLKNWKMIPVFCNIFKKPLQPWGELQSWVSVNEVVGVYRSIVSGGGRPAGVALLPSAESRVVVVDLDIYRVNFGLDALSVASTMSDHGFLAAATPRGGVRLAFSVAPGDRLPGRISVTWFGEPIGEGAGTHKHLWHFPPSAACVEEKERRCERVGRYEFVVRGGRRVRYPWELGISEPPAWRWEEAVEVLRAVLQVDLAEASVSAARGGPRPAETEGVVVIPCWRNLAEFEDWLSGLTPPAIPLPACVARALGYRVEDARNEFTGEKVPHGMRFTLGATAAMFLAATVAEASVEEIVEFVGRNLEDFPSDEGEPLDTKLSRLLAVRGSMVLPRYSGLGSVASAIPVELCASCTYSEVCRTSPSGTSRHVPWAAFSVSFWESLLLSTPPRRRDVDREHM